MRILISPSVFASAAGRHGKLVNLLQHPLEGRHSVFPDPLDAPEFENWLAQRDPSIRKECEAALESSFDLEKRRPISVEVHVSTTDHPRWTDPVELPLDAALAFMLQPLSVFVENNRSDRDFLLAVADAHQRRALQASLDRHWIHFENGGGLPEMNERLKELTPEQRRRSFWIFDSDALVPGEASKQSRDLRRRCQGRVVFHRLGRRAAENYLPPPALREVWAKEKDVQKRKRKARAFEGLRPSQRYWFNMKKGFEGDRDRLAGLPQETVRKVERLYDDLSERREVLTTGFGGRIRDLFKNPLVRREHAWFENDGSREEMRPVIDELLNLR